jgi:Tol biopolymer transport system component
VSALGGSPHRLASASYLVLSPDGGSIFYAKSDNSGIFRGEKSGLNEELAYSSAGTGMSFIPPGIPGRKKLLAAGGQPYSPNFNFYRINLTSHKAADLSAVSGNTDMVWAEPGKAVLFSRNVSGLTNIWKYDLDGSLTQISLGAGPDYSPMPDPGGKGVYYVNGKSSGFLTTYHVHSRESKDIASDDATQPEISPDGRRVMYITLPSPDKSELWASDIDGDNKAKLASGEILKTTWAQDNFHFAFDNAGANEEDKAYVVGADGSGLRQLLGTENSIWNVVWGRAQKSMYVSGPEKASQILTVWKWNVDGSKSGEVR